MTIKYIIRFNLLDFRNKENYLVTYLFSNKNISTFVTQNIISMETNIIVGRNIKAIREKMGYTQGVFADYLGITREEVSYYENGNRTVPSKTITKIAELFAIDEYDLFEEDNAVSKINLALAFRADNLIGEDLKTIANFKNIAMNYLKMSKTLRINHE